MYKWGLPRMAPGINRGSHLYRRKLEISSVVARALARGRRIRIAAWCLRAGIVDRGTQRRKAAKGVRVPWRRRSFCALCVR